MNRPGQARAAIEAHGLCKNYGTFAAVNDVSFVIEQGTVAALLGTNGAGKSTVMRMLTGYLAPTAGSASIAGFDVARDRLEVAARLGYLPENGPLYGDMTPLEMFRFFGEARGLPRSEVESRTRLVATQLDIEAVLDKPAGKLSKGFRQRVGMAQALLHDPEVLIVDEPTAGLDPVQVQHFRTQLRELGRHKSVLLSTHVLHDISAVADRVLVMHEGLLVFDGSPDEFSGPDGLEARFFELTNAVTRAPGTRDTHAEGGMR